MGVKASTSEPRTAAEALEKPVRLPADESPATASAADVPAGTEPRTELPADSRPARLNVAALRRAVSLRVWGGKGSGLPCDFCRVVVGPDDVEYEVEARLDGAVVMLRFHYRCHYSWTGGEEPLIAADRA